MAGAALAPVGVSARWYSTAQLQAVTKTVRAMQAVHCSNMKTMMEVEALCCAWHVHHLPRCCIRPCQRSRPSALDRAGVHVQEESERTGHALAPYTPWYPYAPFPHALPPLDLLAAIVNAVEEGHDVNEVEGAGNIPLHFACYEGWLEG